jgi:4-hydroxymandelate oxidase
MTRREALRAGIGVGVSMLVWPSARLSIAQPSGAAPRGVARTRAVSLSDVEGLAQEHLTAEASAFITGGAADELTVRWNREALDRVRLRPRILVDTSQVDTHLTLFGQSLGFPVLVGPTALHRLVHPDGEVATARGAGKAEAIMVISTFASVPLEDIAKVATPPPWFQLYVQADAGSRAPSCSGPKRPAAGYCV